MSIGIIFLWCVLSLIVGYVATQKNRSFGGFFFLSLIVSPLISLLILIAVPATVIVSESTPVMRRQCPFCAETIKQEAIKCKHCGSDVEKETEDKSEKHSESHNIPKDGLVSISCPSCNISESTPYPRNTAYYKKFNAKEQTFSSGLNLGCKQCGHNFKYQW